MATTDTAATRRPRGRPPARNEHDRKFAEEMKDWPYRFQVIKADELWVDGDNYQRPLTDFVHRIATNWDPAMVGALVVNKRTGEKRYAVIDGQTRLSAGNVVGVPEFPCVAFQGLTIQQEAQLFSRLQKERRNMTSWDRFRAQLAAADPEARAIHQIVLASKYTIGSRPGQIKAVAALESVYRNGSEGPYQLERTLICLQEAWGERHTPGASMVRGLARLLRDEGEEIDDERLARRLGLITPEQIERRAGALQEGRGAGGKRDKYIAEAIQAEYARRGK